MKKHGLITKVLKNSVVISITDSHECDGCTACSHGKSKCDIIEIETSDFFEVGNHVTVEIEDSIYVKGAFLVYLFPLIMFFLGYILAAILKTSENIRIISSFVFLFFSGLISFFIDRFYAKKFLSKSYKLFKEDIVK